MWKHPLLNVNIKYFVDVHFILQVKMVFEGQVFYMEISLCILALTCKVWPGTQSIASVSNDQWNTCV